MERFFTQLSVEKTPTADGGYDSSEFRYALMARVSYQQLRRDHTGSLAPKMTRSCIGRRITSTTCSAGTRTGGVLACSIITLFKRPSWQFASRHCYRLAPILECQTYKTALKTWSRSDVFPPPALIDELLLYKLGKRAISGFVRQAD